MAVSLAATCPESPAQTAHRTVGHQWRKATRAAGLEGLRPHDFRHFCASGLIASGRRHRPTGSRSRLGEHHAGRLQTSVAGPRRPDTDRSRASDGLGTSRSCGQAPTYEPLACGNRADHTLPLRAAREGAVASCADRPWSRLAARLTRDGRGQGHALAGPRSDHGARRWAPLHAGRPGQSAAAAGRQHLRSDHPCNRRAVRQGSARAALPGDHLRCST